MFKSECLFNELVSNLVHSHTFWNETIFAYVTEKYMEFDLNDKGEIGKKLNRP